MTQKFLFSLLGVIILLTGCGSTENKTTLFWGDKRFAIEASQDIIRSEFAQDAEFQSEGTIVESTAVENRYKILQQFYSPERGEHFVYRIWIQKFPTGWEYGNLAIENLSGERVLTLNGGMKAKERADGVGEKITAGGIEFTIAEKLPTVIRIYTVTKLSRDQLKAAILDLMDDYEGIQFATSAKHERGDEYASWSCGSFFDFDSNEIISKDKFLP